MQPSSPVRFNSSINVTPLVDVVLVLLIIFMVVTPQLDSGPAVDLPVTQQPPSRSDDGPRIVVALGHDGALWVEGHAVQAGDFALSLREAATRDAERQVVLHGDARLTFGEVRRAMLAVEAAGFGDIGLIAERGDAAAAGG